MHKTKHHHNGLLDDNRAVEPPESIPNSEVKRSIADGSVGSPHVRVGHRQASILNPSRATCWGFSLCATVCQVALLRFGVEYGESLLPDKGQADLLRPAGSAFPPSMAVTCEQEPVRSAAGVAKRDKQESQTERSSGLIVGHRNRRLICCIQKPR